MEIDRDVDLTDLVHGRHSKSSPTTKEWSGCLRVKEIDGDAREITAVASAEVIDRDNEIISIAAVKAAIGPYMENPVVLAAHSHKTSDGRSSVVGKVTKAWTAGNAFYVKIAFAPTELGQEYWLLYSGKYQRALSIGFRVTAPMRTEMREGKSVDVITALELYEISCVPVGANPAALSKSREGKRRFVAEKRGADPLADDNLAEMLLDYDGKYAHMECMKAFDDDNFPDDDEQGDDLVSLVRPGRR
ncbi:MAG: HK97 family phage prohead protease [Phycisphaerae bacterium]|nr:HK97 family phage prohead protease [Phycisphaerae bacterium]